jgi:hypothetical protein
MISAAVERCAGIAVGKKFLAVCVMVGHKRGSPESRSGSSAPSERSWKSWVIG